MLQVNDDERTIYLVTPAEAFRIIRKQKGTLFISVGQHAPIESDADKVFPIIGNIRVSHAAAVKFIKDAYSDTLVNRGARLKITIMGTCLFIGQPA